MSRVLIYSTWSRPSFCNQSGSLYNFGGCSKGLPVTKQRLSHWIVNSWPVFAIYLAWNVICSCSYRSINKSGFCIRIKQEFPHNRVHPMLVPVISGKLEFSSQGSARVKCVEIAKQCYILIILRLQQFIVCMYIFCFVLFSLVHVF